MYNIVRLMKAERGLMKEKEERDKWEFYPPFVSQFHRSLTRYLL
jgi:hypothetical protein